MLRLAPVFAHFIVKFSSKFWRVRVMDYLFPNSVELELVECSLNFFPFAAALMMAAMRFSKSTPTQWLRALVTGAEDAFK